MSDDCIFCKIANGQIPVALLYQDDLVAAFRDINPAAPTHILIVPRRHVASLLELTGEDAALLAAIQAAINTLAAQDGIAERGFRVVVNTGPDAGQSVAHLHIHLLGGRAMAWPPG